LVYRYVSQPGDVLFFAENWGHIVLTKGGPNLMMNFRKLEFKNFLRQPIDWLHAFVNSALFRTEHNLGRKRTPYNKIMKQIFAKTSTLCGDEAKEEDGRVSEWDKEMIKVIRFQEGKS
jgi:hypothetical protein